MHRGLFHMLVSNALQRSKISRNGVKPVSALGSWHHFVTMTTVA